MSSNEQQLQEESEKSTVASSNLLAQLKPLIASNLHQKLSTADTKKKISDSIMKSGILDMPQKKLDTFEIMSKVQDLLQETINPINAKLPKIYNDISQIQSKILGFDVSVKNQTKEIEYMKSQFEFLRNLEKQVKRIESAFDAEKALNLDKFSVQEANNSQIGKKFDMVDTRFLLVQSNIDSKDDFVKSQVKLQEMHQQKFTDRFDKIFEDLTRDRKRLEKRMAQFDEQVNQYKLMAVSQKKFVEEQMQKYIKETFDKYKIDDNKIMKIDREVSKIQNIEKRAKEMEKTIGKLVDDRNDLHVNSMFLTRSLPILNHLQINDALESVIGIDYQEKLIDFQRSKNKELLEYAQNCQVKCIKFLNQRLYTYLKFMTEEDSGCLPFKYGLDIHPNLTENQLVVVEEKNQLLLRNKFKDFVENKKIIHELFDICARQGKRNDILIEHKLKRAQNNGPLHQVKRLILEHRTQRLKNFDDLDVHLQINNNGFNPNQSTLANESKTQKQEEKNQQNSAFQNPKPVVAVNPSSMKFFLIQGEMLRPYQRFQKKFMSLFYESFKDFKEFKTQQFINLSDQTKFSMEIVKDIDNIKHNIQNIQNDIDQNNSDNFNRNIELRVEINSKQDELQRKVNLLEYQTKENLYNLNKFGKLIEQNIDKIDENGLMMDRRFEFLDQQLQEIQEENLVEQLHEFQQQSRQSMDTMKQELINKFQSLIDEKLSKLQSISANPDKQIENISQNNKHLQRKNTTKLIEQPKKIEKIEQKESQKDKKKDTNNASPLSLKQQKKQELQKMLDEKKRKAELAEQKKKEREEQTEASRIQKLLEMEQNQKVQEEERKRKEAVEKWQKEEQIRKEKRDQLALFNKSQVNKGEELIYNLQNQMAIELIKTENIISKSSNMIKDQQSNKTPQNTQQSQQVKQTSKFEDDGYQDIIKPGKFSSQIPIFTPEKTKQEQIQLINEQIIIWNNKLKLEFFEVIQDQLSKKFNPLQQLFDQEISIIKSNQSQLNEYVNKAVSQIATQQDLMNQSFFDYKKFNEIEFQNINNTLKSEESQYRKMKIQVKGQINFELDKLSGFHTKSDYEFKRVNYILRQNQILISTMLEDIQINQLIQEQDVQDRQELGLFGFKKNQELLGTNQGAMTNIYEKNKDGQKGTSRENQGEWDMKNKNKTYDEVVKKKNIDPVTQMQSFLQKQEDDYLESAQKYTPDNHKCAQNRLQVSKQCASCWGFAPIILQQIKFACLSYISSPISYADGFKMMNGDLLRIKQRLLKKCEIINANINEFLVKNQSNYNILNLNYNNKTINTMRNKIPLNAGDSTQKNNTSKMEQLDTFQRGLTIEIDQLQNTPYQTNDKLTLRESTESQANQNNKQQYLSQDQNQLIYNLNPKLKYNIPTLTSILLFKNPAQNSKENQNKQIYTLKKNEIFKISDTELEQIIGTELRREQIFKDIFNQQNVEQIYSNVEKEMFKVERELEQIQIIQQKNYDNSSTVENLERVTYSYISKGVDNMKINVKNKVQKLKDDVFNSNYQSSLQNQQLRTISFNNKKSTPGFQTSKNENQRLRPAFDNPQLNMHVTNDGDFMILGDNTDVPSKISESEFRQKKGFFTKRAMKRGASIGAPVVNTQPINQKVNVLSEKTKQFPQVNYNFKITQQTQEMHQNSKDQSYLNQRAKSLNQTTELQNTDFQSTRQPSVQRKQAFANNLSIKTSEIKQKIEIRAKTPQNQRYINEKLVTERGITSQPFSNMMENLNDTLNSQINQNVQNFRDACQLVDSDFKDINTVNDINQFQEKNQIYSLDVSMIKNNNSLLKR